jgi:hypothetical protein
VFVYYVYVARDQDKARETIETIEKLSTTSVDSADRRRILARGHARLGDLPRAVELFREASNA